MSTIDTYRHVHTSTPKQFVQYIQGYMHLHVCTCPCLLWYMSASKARERVHVHFSVYMQVLSTFTNLCERLNYSRYRYVHACKHCSFQCEWVFKYIHVHVKQFIMDMKVQANLIASTVTSESHTCMSRNTCAYQHFWVYQGCWPSIVQVHVNHSLYPHAHACQQPSNVLVRVSLLVVDLYQIVNQKLSESQR